MRFGRRRGSSKRSRKSMIKILKEKKILEEHLKNVEMELVHTKSLIDNKNKETETENHLWQVFALIFNLTKDESFAAIRKTWWNSAEENSPSSVKD